MTRRADRPEHPVPAGKRSASDVVARLRAASPDVLRALGADAPGEAAWAVTERDRYEVSWPGERLGPSTLSRYVLASGEAKAEISLDVVRWTPSNVHQTTLSYRWAVGEEVAGGVEIVNGDRPFRTLPLRGPEAVADVLREALRRGHRT